MNKSQEILKLTESLFHLNKSPKMHSNKTGYKITVEIYPGDHPPAHCHIKSLDGKRG